MIRASDVRDLIHDEIANFGSQKAVAERIGVSASYLSDVLLARREPGPKIADYFDLEPITFYTPKDSPGISTPIRGA